MADEGTVAVDKLADDVAVETSPAGWEHPPSNT